MAKFAVIKLCGSFNAKHGTRYTRAMPANFDGPDGDFDLQKSPVLPALIRKAHEPLGLDAFKDKWVTNSLPPIAQEPQQPPG